MTREAARRENILVIKLGALGDFVQALGPFAAIRAHHDARDATGHAHITLLTTPPFEALAARTGFFDSIWTDGRPKGLIALLALVRRMSWAHFTRVYDLQTSSRSSLYFHLLRPRTEWSGIARGASHPHGNPLRDRMHTVDRQAEQLRAAGIAETPQGDVTRLAGDIPAHDLVGTQAPFGLLVPGSAPTRPAKRWPIEGYVSVAREWAAQGLVPVAIGTASEAGLGAAIARAVPGAVDLTGRTSVFDIVTLARAAARAVGNDTGPMHLIAAAGVPTVVLFGADADPALCAPRGPHVTILAADDIRAHTPAAVLRAGEAACARSAGTGGKVGTDKA